MIVKCERGCGIYFDDEFRSTICPHKTFPANDGQNNFTVHEDSYRSANPPNNGPSVLEKFADDWQE